MPRKKPSHTPDVSTKERMLTLDEAAKALGVSRSTLYRWQNQGRVPGFKVGRQWRFRRSDLDKFGQMAHPSAAAVNVGELRALLGEVKVPAEDISVMALEPPLRDYPRTEEERAVDALFGAVLISAVRNRASDIHLDADRDGTIVRQRIDGVLHQTVRVPKSAHPALVACAKAHAGLPLDQRSLPQDGRFGFRVGDDHHDVRLATIPAVYGESVVMRILPQSVDIPPLDRLGMHLDDVERYRHAITSPKGLLVVSGPSGSGKTTVLYAGLRAISRLDVKFHTVEDPVEYAFPHVTQVAVKRKAGLTFEAAQRALMRHDPDVIMLGGIRSLESAELAVHAAITGHLVMTQFHAETAANVVTRLLDMGVEAFMLAETLIYISAQRLARKVCSQCSQPDKPDFDTLSPLAGRARLGGYVLPEEPRFIRGAGCEKCRQTGYRGRTGIYEVMEVNRKIQRLIAARADTKGIEEAAVRSGMTTLAADGLRKAAEGSTTVAEVARLLPSDAGR